jgi:hypothetical protein
MNGREKENSVDILYEKMSLVSVKEAVDPLISIVTL